MILSSTHKNSLLIPRNRKGFFDEWETAGFHFAKHRYRIENIVPYNRINLLSECSEIRVLELFRNFTRSEVEFHLKDAPEKDPSLGFSIRIAFPNWIRHLLARLLFTEYIWQVHAREEMSALAHVMQKQYKTINADPS